MPPGSHERGWGWHLLGTDHLGRDILSRMVHGARVSLFVAVIAVLISGTIGTAVGLLSGYRGGRVDDVLMRVTEVQLACPFILLALAVAAVLRPNLRNTVAVLAISGWVIYAKVVRSRVLSLRESEFLAAARALGATGSRLVLRHLLPNMLSTCIVLATVEAARMIILESALSFLGLGVQPPNASWGGMLRDGKLYISSAWWYTTFPGLAIMLTVLGLNMVGDSLRDLLDPRLKV
ncbi:MAG: ABC transporter permease [Candidatus Rokubacteria bacterium]|nr:ABC transporter permease [Candidatus Rokubacteria bacterium]